MESILAKALEYTLKYWLKSFTRDQFKLQGRTVQLSNLDINGDALHASVELPPALTVTTAKVGKLEIVLPSVSTVQTEPIVVQIDKLDLVLEENPNVDASQSPNSTQLSSTSSKGSGYGFADKIADGMTLEVHIVNLLLIPRGGARHKGGSTWASPMASITIKKLMLYTTNENWQVVSLKEARDFSANKGFIYVFKKLEWESLSIDLLPHPDMFTDATLGRNQRDDDGAKRVFFGGERFMEGISGQAYITVKRTEQNSPFGLEVQMHVTEAVCPALSEPGLRALLRFMTGLYVILNRGDVDVKAHQGSAEAAGRSFVSIVVDHIFLCVKDTEFQLELLMQSLFFSRATVSNGDIENTLSKVMISGLFLRDTFIRPPCTLVQPSMQAVATDLHIPDFGKNFCAPIYPLGQQQWQLFEGVPMISLHSLQVKPSPTPPSLASQTVINCQPIEVHLQEASCLRIFSFLADGIVVNPGAVLPDFSVNSLEFILKELYLTVPLDKIYLDKPVSNDYAIVQNAFSGARLHIQNLYFSESPSLKMRLLQLEKDPACFSLWEDQPIDASQKKWTAGASHLSLSLERSSDITGGEISLDLTSTSWSCVDFKDACVEVAMATADGKPLKNVPPPGGIVRVGVACEQYLSNASVEQLFFVLNLYSYFCLVGEKIAVVGKSNRPKITRSESLSKLLMDKVPSDTAVSLAVKDLQLRFLESSSMDVQGMPLVQFVGEELFIKVSHRTLGGAILVTSKVCWESIEVDCLDTENMAESGRDLIHNENGTLTSVRSHPHLRAIFWVNHKSKHEVNADLVPFLDIFMEHMIPFNEQDIESHSVSVSACMSGVRLGGGMNYTEALLHRFGILGPDGGPSEGLSRGLENLSAGPLSKLFKPAPLAVNDQEEERGLQDERSGSFLHLGRPDNFDVSIELKDWLFALEGAENEAEWRLHYSHEEADREGRCWHTTFDCLQVKAKSSLEDALDGKVQTQRMQRHPVEFVTVGVKGLQALKPQAKKNIIQCLLPQNGIKDNIQTSGGINLEARLVIIEENVDDDLAKWAVENIKFSVEKPIEAVVTKDELQHLALLFKSEVDSMGRITAGVLRLLKLEKSLGQAAISQLSNLGTETLDKLFSTPEKLSKGCKSDHIEQSPSSSLINGSQDRILSVIASLEEEITESQAKCATLNTEFCSLEPLAEQAANVKQLTQRLETMKELLTQLRTQI